MKTNVKTAFAIFAVALMVFVAAVPAAVSFTGSDGVATINSANDLPISNVEIKIFDKITDDSRAEDYADMVYCISPSDKKLPICVNPADYAPVQSLYWMNVNAESSDYGKYLTFGDTGMSIDEIKQYANPYLPIVQFKYTMTDKANIEFEVSYNGSQTEGQGYFDHVEQNDDIKILTQDSESTYYFPTGRQVIHSVQIVPDVFGERPSTLSGIYSCAVYCNGNIAGINELVLGDASVIVGGYAKDVDNTAIVGASVAYTVNGKTMPVAITTTGGKFQFAVEPGSVVSITGVSFDGKAYTFDNSTKNYGTLIESPEDVTFKANEKTQVITITDDSNVPMPIVGATISAKWYKTVTTTVDQTEVKTISAVSNDGKAVVIGKTNDAGKVSVAYINPKEASSTSYDLVFQASNSGIKYTFDAPDIITGVIGETKSGKEVRAVSAQVNEHDGLATTGDNVSITALESSIVITVKGSFVDENTDGKALVEGAKVSAKWYNEYNDADEKHHIDNITKGGAKAVTLTDKTDAFGKITLIYLIPNESGVTYNSLQLVVYAEAGTSGYTFDTKTINTTKQPIETIDDQIGELRSMESIGSSSIDNLTLYTGSDVYQVEVDVTGVTPAVKDVAVKYKIDSKESTVKTNADGKAYFNIFKGKFATISCSFDGYIITYGDTILTSYTTPNINGDVAYTFKATALPTVTSMVNVGAQNVGFSVTFSEETKQIPVLVSYTVYGVMYTNIIMTKGAANVGQVMTLKPYGWEETEVNGYSVEVVSVEADGYDIEYDPATKEWAPIKLTNETLRLTGEYDKYYGAVPVDEIEVTIYYPDGELCDVTVTNALGFGKFQYNASYGGEIEPGDLTYVCFGHIAHMTNGEVDATNAYHEFIDDIPDVTTKVMVEYKSESQTPLPGGTEKTVLIGSTLKLTAPEYNDHKFIGWYVDGVFVSAEKEISIVIESTTSVITAAYSGVAPVTPSQGIDTTTLILGIIAIVIALIAVAYVIIQAVRKN